MALASTAEARSTGQTKFSLHVFLSLNAGLAQHFLMASAKQPVQQVSVETNWSHHTQLLHQQDLANLQL